LGFFGGSGELIASNMVGKYSTIELHLCWQRKKQISCSKNSSSSGQHCNIAGHRVQSPHPPPPDLLCLGIASWKESILLMFLAWPLLEGWRPYQKWWTREITWNSHPTVALSAEWLYLCVLNECLSPYRGNGRARC
jgi:hypothetical protein